MNVPERVGDSEIFREVLVRIGMVPEVYRALELVFRQAMMTIGKEGGQIYRTDRTVEGLFNSDLAIQEKISLINEYIAEWELSHHPRHNPKVPRPLCYGFAALHIDEFDVDQKAIDTLEAEILLMHKTLGSTLGEDADRVFSSMAKKLRAGFRRKAERTHDSARSRYVKPPKGGHDPLSLDYFKWSYFKVYLILSKLIFGPAIAENQLTKFLSAKIVREHFHLEGIEDKFTASEIGNRMRKTNAAENRLNEKLLKSGLMSPSPEQFVNQLRQYSNLLKKVAI